MTTPNEAAVRNIIDDAEEYREPSAIGTAKTKPRLLVESHNPNITVAALRDILSCAGVFYDRGVPVRLAFDQTKGGTIAQGVTPDTLVMLIHEICRPYEVKKREGELLEIDCRFPRAFAVMYLDWHGGWRLPPLNGITSAPLISAEGTIRSAEGYDRTSGMWQENAPDLTEVVPDQPTMQDAQAALLTLRKTFKTFCFADAETVSAAGYEEPVVNISKSPGRDESAFVIALLTAVCRPSLPLAPGILLRAAPLSGAGAGKGLLARCMSIIAFGREPHAVTSGGSSQELEKRIAAELMAGGPTLFLDNLNSTSVKSELLASAITERPARVRLLGKSEMLPLNASALVMLTGNGLNVSEDLARRFITIELDARTENPEFRTFATDIRAEVTERQTELLAALLIIWRWGRMTTSIRPGCPLGSFEQWGTWVRDPLLALGCMDPAARISEMKESDAGRQQIAELYAVWWQKHKNQPVSASDLSDDVTLSLDPQKHGRQYRVSRLQKLTGTRVASFVLTKQKPVGKWSAATYTLEPTGDDEEHRGHRGHGNENPPLSRTDTLDMTEVQSAHGTEPGTNTNAMTPMTPMTPMLTECTETTSRPEPQSTRQPPMESGKDQLPDLPPSINRRQKRVEL